MASFFLSPESDRYYAGRAFTYGNRQYTKAGATRETFEALGFSEVTIGYRPDDRFYFVSGPDNTGAYSSEPRDLEDLKVSFAQQENLNARALLSQTDWYIIRQLESEALGVPIATPAAISTDRSAIRDLANQRVADIMLAASIEDLQALIATPVEYPSDEE